MMAWTSSVLEASSVGWEKPLNHRSRTYRKYSWCEAILDERAIIPLIEVEVLLECVSSGFMSTVMDSSRFMDLVVLS